MSTILEALKKAEPQPTIVRQRIGVVEPPLQKAGRFSGSRFKKRGPVYLLVAVILCIAGVGVWRNMSPLQGIFENQETKTYRIAKPSSSETIPALDPAKKSNRQPETDVAVQDRINPRPISPGVKDTSRQPSTTILPRQASNAKPRLPKKNHAPQTTVNTSGPSRDKTKGIKSDPKRAMTPDAGNVAPWHDARPLENKKMKLQALAWASDPGKRMVVIGGQVIREGDDVNGYDVVKIMEDKIILQQGGQYYRLAFQR
jgi:hypothetical protein